MLTRVDLEPVYVLHRRPYSNTSLIVELLSMRYGRLAAMARGARSAKSRYRGKLQLFTPLLASWVGRGEIKTLTVVELSAKAYLLDGDALLCGFYLNELLMRLLQRDDPCPKTFGNYHDTLSALEQQHNLPVTLRIFEKKLLAALGYGLPLTKDAKTGEAIHAAAHYRYLPERGFTRVMQEHVDHSHYSGASLLALANEQFIDANCLREVKKLLRLVIAAHLGNKPLKSREMLV